MRKSHGPDPEVLEAADEFAHQVDQYRTMARAYYHRPRVSPEEPTVQEEPLTRTAPRESRALWWPGMVVAAFAIIGFLAVLDEIAHIL